MAELEPGGGDIPAPVDLGGRLRWEGDAAGRLLLFDCSDDDLAEAYALFFALQRELRAQPDGSVRLLINFRNAVSDTRLTRLWREAAHENNRAIRRSALVHVSGPIKVAVLAYRFYSMVRGLEVDSRMRLFDDLERARAWLAEA